jgi:hypothetical protein
VFPKKPPSKPEESAKNYRDVVYKVQGPGRLTNLEQFENPNEVVPDWRAVICYEGQLVAHPQTDQLCSLAKQTAEQPSAQRIYPKVRSTRKKRSRIGRSKISIANVPAMRLCRPSAAEAWALTRISSRFASSTVITPIDQAPLRRSCRANLIRETHGQITLAPLADQMPSRIQRYCCRSFRKSIDFQHRVFDGE